MHKQTRRQRAARSPQRSHLAIQDDRERGERQLVHGSAHQGEGDQTGNSSVSVLPFFESSFSS